MQQCDNGPKPSGRPELAEPENHVYAVGGGADRAACGESDAAGRIEETLLARLARVEAALQRWEAYKVDAARPPERRQGVRAPPLTRTTLEELRRALAEELNKPCPQ